MVKAPRFEWDLQDDSRLKYFRSSAPPEDRAIFLHDQVGPCLEDENLGELGQSFNRCTQPTIYEWCKQVRQCLDLEVMDLFSLEKLSIGSVDDLLHFTWQPAASKSRKKHHLFLDCLEFIHHTFSEEEILELAEEHSIHEDEATDSLPSADGQIDRLGEWYEFRDYEAVKRFLIENPFLIQILFKAHREIRDIFGTVLGMVLRVVADPEAIEEQELFLYIQTKLHPTAARPLLDELSRKWWLGAMLDAKGEMNITLEYI